MTVLSAPDSCLTLDMVWGRMTVTYALMHNVLVSLPPDPPPSLPAASFLSKQWGPPHKLYCGRINVLNLHASSKLKCDRVGY